jgi:hypothetical protein
MEKGMVGDVSEDQLVFLKSLVSVKESGISSKALEELLGAYSKTGYSAIAELPLELALISIISPSAQ